jgi:peroxiredoxin
LELHHAEIETAGLRILAIGLGEPKHARHFGGKLAPNVECLTDEKPTLYEAFGIEKGNILRLLAPDAMAAGARAAKQGHRQGEATGDMQRLPGTFIIDGQGIVRYAYYGKHAGDQPDLTELVNWWLGQKAAA